MADIAPLVFNGLLVGGIYALGGVGLTLVYGILRLANFAHGDTLTVGAYVAWIVIAASFAVSPVHIAAVLVLALFAVAAWDLSAGGRLQKGDRLLLITAVFVLVAVTALRLYRPTGPVLVLSGLVLSATFVALLSAGLDVLLWRKLRKERANILTLMIVSIGVAFVLRSLVQMTFSGKLRVILPRAGGINTTITGWMEGLGLGIRVTNTDVWILGTTVVAVAFTQYVLTGTRTGKAMRALADNMDLARVSGIDTDRIMVHVWLLGGALAGIAGTLLAMYTSLNVNLGWFALLSLFAAVILGGVGSVPGALAGGLVIGVAQEVSTLWIDTGYKLAVGFAILIVTLLVRPQGIMGVARG